MADSCVDDPKDPRLHYVRAPLGAACSAASIGETSRMMSQWHPQLSP